MKKVFKQTVAFLENHGYEFDRLNNKGTHFYVRTGCHDVGISSSIDDRVARHIQAGVQKALGIDTDRDKKKRSPETVKARQSDERERLAASIERSRREIDLLIAQREACMDGLGRLLTTAELRAIERLIEARERELREWRRLMTEAPSNNAHSGRLSAQHRS